MSQPSRRRFIVGAGAGVAGLSTGLFGMANAFAAKPIHAMHDEVLQACIDQCHKCEATCLATVQHCIQAGGLHVQSAHMNALFDCATLCRTSADIMGHGSALMAQVCAVCVDACTACATSCEALADDAAMGACAQECRACAESCASMAQ